MVVFSLSRLLQINQGILFEKTYMAPTQFPFIVISSTPLGYDGEQENFVSQNDHF
jgi:hypothetical protein